MPFRTLEQRIALVENFRVSLHDVDWPDNILRSAINLAFPSVKVTASGGLQGVIDPTRPIDGQLDIVLFAEIFWEAYPTRQIRIYTVDRTQGYKYFISKQSNQYHVYHYRLTSWTLEGRYTTFEAAIIEVAYALTLSQVQTPVVSINIIEQCDQLLVLLEDVREGIPDNMEIKEAIGLVNVMSQGRESLSELPNDMYDDMLGEREYIEPHDYLASIIRRT